MRVFVDTSYYIARVMPGDQWLKAAVKAVRPWMKRLGIVRHSERPDSTF